MMRILSEESDKDKNLIWNLIGEFGLKHTIEIFGGFDNFIEKLNTTPKQFMLDYFLDKVYDIKDSGFPVGGYDFKYKVVDIQYDSGYDEYIFYVIITEGEVTIINGETYDLLSNEIPEEILGEIESEIKDIFNDIFYNFLNIIGNNESEFSIVLEN